MNCPVCHTTIKLDFTNLEEFYYDCSVCHSSLFFQDGKFEVISRGQVPQPSQLADPEESSPYEESSYSEESPLEQQSSHQSEDGDPTSDEGVRGDEATLEKETRDVDPRVPEHSELSLEPREEAKTETKTKTKTEIPMTDYQDSDFQESFESDQKESSSLPEVPEITEDQVVQEYQDPQSDPELNQALPPEEKADFEEKSFVFKEEESVEMPQEDFSEVVEFSKDNKPEKTGLYAYKLFLSEINSQSTKDKVIEILEDESLELDLEETDSYKEILRDKGKMELDRLSAIQLYIILHKLMGLPLKVYWEQSHIADS